MKDGCRAAQAAGLSLLIVAAAIAHGESGQQTRPRKIETLEGRPLAAAIQEVERRFGWVVTYEDPPYELPSEIVDVAAAVRRDGRFDKPVLVPREKYFAFEFDPADEADPQRLLAKMLDVYHASGNDETFRLLKEGTVFHVVPVMNSNAMGVPTPRQSLLDQRVTVDEGEYTVLSAIQMVLQQLTSPARPEGVWSGVVPMNMLLQTRVRMSAATATARELILRALAATNAKLSWRLFCGPGRASCAFNVHRVDAPE